MTVPLSRLLALAAALVVVAGTAVAEEPAPYADDAEPRFVIERIVVDGVRRLPPEIVVSESLLVAGGSYGEAELRAAADRIERLPFVLAADFSLARGSARGLYELHVAVEETRLFFFGGELSQVSYARALRFDAAGAESASHTLSRVAGVRMFLGRYGQAHLAAGNDSGVEVGYTRYRLFGRPALLGVSYAAGVCCEVSVPPLGLDPALSAWSQGDAHEVFRVTLGLPLTATFGLRLEAERREAEDGSRRGVLGDVFAPSPSAGAFLHEGFSERRIEAGVVHDTTDDPLFPGRGTALTVAVDLRRLEARLTGPEVPGTPLGDGVRAPYSSRLARLTVTAARHWSPRPRQTLGVTARASGGVSRVEGLPVGDERVDRDLDVWDAAVGVRHRLRLLDRRSRWGELHWESFAEAGAEDTSPTVDLGRGLLRRATVGTGLVLRNAWGVFRLTFSYLDLEDGG